MVDDRMRDFALRTKQNLECVARHQQGSDGQAAQIVQLANSLLGLLAFPPQALVSSLPTTPLAEVGEGVWSGSESSLPANDLGDLVRRLRTAAGYSNLEFLAGEDGAVTGIRVWNQRNRQRTWQAEFSAAELQAVVDVLIELLALPSEADSTGPPAAEA
jgi:hypothetical protein